MVAEMALNMQIKGSAVAKAYTFNSLQSSRLVSKQVKTTTLQQDLLK